MKVNRGQSKTFLVDGQELAQLLNAFRKRRNDTRQSVETRLQKLMRETDRQCSAALSRGIHSLERSQQPLELRLADLELIAQAYGIPRLMLDPLLVTRRDSTCVVQSWAGLQPNRFDSKPGHRVEYEMPEARLSNTDLAIVRLRLDIDGHSTVHSHPGDELIFVLHGSVEVRFAGSGLWTRLDKGDYVHFYAEQEHGAWNIGAEPAVVLVVRFYQLGRPGTRLDFLKQLNAKDRENRVTERAVREMIATVMPGASPITERGVVDRIGLARLMPMFCAGEMQQSKKPISLNELTRRARRVKLPYSRARFDRLHQGQAAVSVEDLPKLALVYGIEPLLLYDFVYPAWTTAIAVRKKSDFRAIPPEIVTGQGVRYSVPAQRLANSDISIVRLEMERLGSTPKNRHPGHELLLPLKGAVEVQIGGLHARVAAGEHLFIHYHSSVDHQVINKSDGPAELLVIRLYE